MKRHHIWRHCLSTSHLLSRKLSDVSAGVCTWLQSLISCSEGYLLDDCFSGHKSSFNLERYKNSTALSTEVWRIKLMDGEPEIKWRVVRKAKAYTPESKRCLLCLAEKFEIANHPGDNLLNKRSEIVAKCRHRRKHLITFYQANVT